MKWRARPLRHVELYDVAATPSIADDRPMGSGTTNRHGMPRLPPGQYETTKSPVRNISGHSSVTMERWRLHVVGAVASPLVLTWPHCIDGFEQGDRTNLPLAEALKGEGVSSRHGCSTCRQPPCSAIASARRATPNVRTTNMALAK